MKVEKEIKIKIDDKGILKGTVGWLLKNADHVTIKATRYDNQGAWLKNKKGETLSVLAIRDWNDDGEVAIIQEFSHGGCALCPNFKVSDPCLKKLQEIAEIAAETMDEIWNHDDPDYRIKLSVEK